MHVGDPKLITGTQHRLAREGIARAVREHNTDRLYDWLIVGLAFQGIADRVAWGYIEAHGSPERRVITAHLATTRCACPKLASFDDYLGCGYRKAARTCARPQHLRLCPVRKLPLRKGLLNVQAYSLHLFLRDRCSDDLVGMIDNVITAAIEAEGEAGPWAVAAQRALVAEFSQVDGISAKVANMVLSDLLLGARRADPRWLAVGAEMVAIDTLVHKVLERTGILKSMGAEHSYGPACHGPWGCEAAVRELALAVDATAVNPAFPTRFPRLLQKALWQLAAQQGLDLCNARRVGTRPRCEVVEMCPVGGLCFHGAGRPE